MEDNLTYVAADCRFYDPAAAQEMGLSIDEYNQMVTDKINSYVRPKDGLILMGKITFGDLTQTKELIKKLNGTKYIIDYSIQGQFNSDEWKEIGFSHIWDCPGAVEKEIDGVKSFIILETTQEHLALDLLRPNCYIAAASSLINKGCRYKDKVLNISLNEWDFEPIEVGERLGQIIDDQELFARMEDKE